MTEIRTARAKYLVTEIRHNTSGKTEIHVRGTNGARRVLTRKDVSTPRWYGALAHFYRA